MTLTPAARELRVDPGGEISTYVTVVNRNDHDLTVTIMAAPYGVKGLEYTPDFQPIADKADPSAWFTIAARGPHTLKPQATLDIPLALHVPADTAPGGYYAVIFATSQPPSTPTSGIVAQARLGSIMYITVNGDVEKRGHANAETIAWLQSAGMIPLSSKVSNTGGIHFTTTVTTSVKNILGQEVYHDSQQRYILPQTERRVTTDWRSESIMGLFRIERTVSLPSGDLRFADVWCIVVHPFAWAALAIGISAIIGYMLIKRRNRR